MKYSKVQTAVKCVALITVRRHTVSSFSSLLVNSRLTLMPDGDLKFAKLECKFYSVEIPIIGVWCKLTRSPKC